MEQRVYDNISTLKRHKQSVSFDSENKPALMKTSSTGKVWLNQKKNSLSRSMRPRLGRIETKNILEACVTKESQIKVFSTVFHLIENLTHTPLPQLRILKFQNTNNRKYSLPRSKLRQKHDSTIKSIPISNKEALEIVPDNGPAQHPSVLNPISEKAKNIIKSKLLPIFSRNRREDLTINFT
ncbi:unnamed protein product [Moneuplotes crassus]|uniref:Uncharacterized protein n=1 Tax=Euplotes crassus TaxID=5936 RepID=A0AAD1U6A7_EUPCR|nr:unnamed protein product [Moneuplotes crassus]